MVSTDNALRISCDFKPVRKGIYKNKDAVFELYSPQKEESENRKAISPHSDAIFLQKRGAFQIVAFAPIP
jgi:hypothetical protein